MKITRITAEGFLGARSVSVETRQPIQLFAGANGAGKSSVRDAVALALTADLGRVSLKKDAGQLVHSQAQHALCEVVDADGDTWAVTITSAGKIADSQKGREADPVLGYVLDAQRFARLDATARRAFLFGLMGVKADAVSVRQRLVAKGCDGALVDRVLPMLRSGFPAAHDEAKSKATAAKGAWRAVTGETFGSEKAKTWRAAVPAYDPGVGKALATELQHADVALEQWQRQIGGLAAQQQHRAGLQAKLPGLQEQAARTDRLKAKLAADNAQLQHWDAELKRVRAAAAGGVVERVGLVHDLAKAVNGLLVLGNVDRDSVVGMQANRALASYVAEHGPVVGTQAAGQVDHEARAKLPEVEKAHALMTSSVANTQRDLTAAERAAAEVQTTLAELAEPFDGAALEAARAQVETLKTQRAEVVKKLDAQKSVKALVDAADKKTADASAHAADVAVWDAIAQALAPDGIPAELLAEALGPINDRLAQSAADAQWPAVNIAPDMFVAYGARPYGLCSESEQWRADAMVAEAIAHISGARLLVLDRFDVLDLPGRADLIAWLDVLADNGEIDTALIFGTLKALPSSLPATFGAHWLAAGSVEQLKDAA
jgi:hypothetical protein